LFFYIYQCYKQQLVETLLSRCLYGKYQTTKWCMMCCFQKHCICGLCRSSGILNN
jgi:hypothetical protein